LTAATTRTPYARTPRSATAVPWSSYRRPPPQRPRLLPSGCRRGARARAGSCSRRSGRQSTTSPRHGARRPSSASPRSRAASSPTGRNSRRRCTLPRSPVDAAHRQARPAVAQRVVPSDPPGQRRQVCRSRHARGQRPDRRHHGARGGAGARRGLQAHEGGPSGRQSARRPAGQPPQRRGVEAGWEGRRAAKGGHRTERQPARGEPNGLMRGSRLPLLGDFNRRLDRGSDVVREEVDDNEPVDLSKVPHH
jgi:hypothetical protein